MQCDLCADPVEGTCIDRADMRYAALHGFCPIEHGMIQKHSKTDLEDLTMGGLDFPAFWHTEVISGGMSLTDWIVCAECLIKLLPYLPTTELKEA